MIALFSFLRPCTFEGESVCAIVTHAFECPTLSRSQGEDIT